MHDRPRRTPAGPLVLTRRADVLTGTHPLTGAVALLRSCHPGPSAAVTALSAAFAWSSGLMPGRVLLVALAVLTGQLSIGWGNDLLDADRDRAVGRLDKPLASGDVPLAVGRMACGLAVLATVVLSLACGALAGAIHLVLVAAGWSYNLGVKATVLSWVPYAVAFGGLPVFIALAGGSGSVSPPWWVPAAGALLGVGAHLLNVLPDLADDEATGVRGLAHWLGPRRASLLAVAGLVSASVLLVLGVDVPVPVSALVLVVVGVLAVLALVGRGKVPFLTAIGIALADVILLVVAG